MFTGIVEEIGILKIIKSEGRALRLSIDLGNLSSKNLQIGESIALNGSCHTLEKLLDSGNSGKLNKLGVFFSSPETLEKTNISFLKTGDFINLELSLTPETRVGGHFVSGHIDSLAKFLGGTRDGKAHTLNFEIPEQFAKYVINKGSVCLNGISLTVAKINGNVFSVAVIPHTFENTNLKTLRAGSLVNFEADMLAKYTEKLLSTGNISKS